MRAEAAAALVLLAACSSGQENAPSPTLEDGAFWRLVTEMSEPDGSFASENLLSDERCFQRVIPRLQASLPDGGVYLGVGPEQNFTYIAALRPKLAFIVDIRRGNLVVHLFYKALFELSADRADFVSRLFGRPRPDAMTADVTVSALMDAFRAALPDAALRTRTLEAVRLRLSRDHHFPLSPDDLGALDHVSDAFFRAGPDIDYNFPEEKFGTGRIGGEPFPTYAELMAETDGAGRPRSYLASEENFRRVADCQRRNAIVPLVGDFAGPKTLRAIGRFIAGRGETVTAFYTSNVEVYLFRSDAWKRFYQSLATIPVDAKSTIIRFGSNRGFDGPTGLPGPGTSTRLAPASELVRAFEAGDIRHYVQVLEMGR